MRCIRPTRFNNSEILNACGQCMPCRITRKREWQTRLMLEWYTFKQGAFVTLTYKPEELPEAEKFKGGNLIKKDFQDFMKRFRRNFERSIGKRQIRFFGVGEYGDQSERAHFHALIYNASPEEIEMITKKSWNKGHSLTAELHRNRVEYTVGYTIKKLTDKSKLPNGKNPEFSLQSRRPPIGHYAIPQFAKAMRKRRLLPERAFTLEERLELRKNEIARGMKNWNGQFYQEGKYNRIESPMLRKMTIMAYPEIFKMLKINIDHKTIEEIKELKAYTEHLTQRVEIGTINFMEGEEYGKTKNKSEKIERKFKKTKAI